MQIDFAQLCRDYAVPYRQEVDGWVNVQCPICGHQGSRGYKGGLNIAGGYFHCWACGGSGIEKVIAELIGVSYHEVSPILERYSNQISIRQKLNKKEHKASSVTLPMEGLMDERCCNYLLRRNFDPDYLQQKYNLCGATLTGEWAGRIIIPIYFNGKLISFQGRAIYSKKKCTELGILRYKTLSKHESVFDPKSILYNIDNCKNDYLILTEGPFDAMRWGDDCAATLGTSTTPEQRMLIAGRFSKVFIIFDPEPEALERAEKLGDMLYGLGVKEAITINTMKDCDMGDMHEDEIETIKKDLGL